MPHPVAVSASTSPTESFQVPLETARAYEATFVPAFFAQWAPLLCGVAGIRSGSSVLDVACGTGIVARTAAELAGPGNVVGVDLNEAMLTVARQVRADIDWRQGDVAALPFPDAGFDAVVCQMALMFFPDRRAAVREMARVAAPGATVAVLVPSALAAQPAYGPFVDMAARHAGPEAHALLSTYFVCGDPPELRAMLEHAGLSDVRVRVETGAARFPSIDALVSTEVRSTPLADRLTEQTYEAIRVGANEVLAPFTGADGTLTAPFECLVVAGTVPPRG